MRDAARDALTFARGETRSSLDSDRMLVFAIVKAVEILGEAAYQMSEEGRAELPEFPWRAIIGMRHRLVHAYLDIDLDRVWDTLAEDLPMLMTRLTGEIERRESS